MLPPLSGAGRAAPPSPTRPVAVNTVQLYGYSSWTRVNTPVCKSKCEYEATGYRAKP